MPRQELPTIPRDHSVSQAVIGGALISAMLVALLAIGEVRRAERPTTPCPGVAEVGKFR